MLHGTKIAKRLVWAFEIIPKAKKRRIDSDERILYTR
jgi:hypothetical protein